MREEFRGREEKVNVGQQQRYTEEREGKVGAGATEKRNIQGRTKSHRKLKEMSNHLEEEREKISKSTEMGLKGNH